MATLQITCSLMTFDIPFEKVRHSTYRNEYVVDFFLGHVCRATFLPNVTVLNVNEVTRQALQCVKVAVLCILSHKYN